MTDLPSSHPAQLGASICSCQHHQKRNCFLQPHFLGQSSKGRRAAPWLQLARHLMPAQSKSSLLRILMQRCATACKLVCCHCKGGHAAATLVDAATGQEQRQRDLPGMIARWGKCPGKKLSLIVTFLYPTAYFSGSSSMTLSTRRKGNLQCKKFSN